MFHSSTPHNLLFERVAHSRLKSTFASEVVTRQFLDKHDFGAEFFQKVLGKSILKPGSMKPSSIPVKS